MENHLGKITLSTPDRDSNLDHTIISSLIYYENSAFDHEATENAVIMGLGLLALSISVGYIAYMRSKYEGMGYYAAVTEDGKETFVQKKSKWD
uniref:Small integral membrane protein 8 n=1 Tax=Timema genevievae TaxID=629358 RepID=A0A7R9K175_TIMGE|nr:unnamed protein product [Timema genevievae]